MFQLKLVALSFVILQVGNEPQLRLDGRCARDRRRGAGEVRVEGEDEGVRHRGRGKRRLGTGELIRLYFQFYNHGIIITILGEVE